MIEELKRIVKLYRLEKEIYFLGYRDDIKDLLSASDVFCFLSKREGLGLAAVDAMASGLPLITSNIHGIKDYSINGKSGFTIAPLNVEGVTEAIKKCMKI